MADSKEKLFFGLPTPFLRNSGWKKNYSRLEKALNF